MSVSQLLYFISLPRTWQKAGNTNHGSTYSIHHTLAGRWRMRDVLANFAKPHDLNEERIELELLAKKKELRGVWPGWIADFKWRFCVG